MRRRLKSLYADCRATWNHGETKPRILRMTRMIDKEFLEGLFKQAEENLRKRVNYDMRTSPEDGS